MPRIHQYNDCRLGATNGLNKPADLSGQILTLQEFIEFLVEAGETEGLGRKVLYNLYGEFCLDTNSKQLSEGQFLRQLRAAGIQRYRDSIGQRRWFYRVQDVESVRSKLRHSKPLKRQFLTIIQSAFWLRM